MLVAGAFLAGFVDAVVGGGGLIQLPLLMAVYPGVGIPLLFATNKLSSLAGTSVAAVHYSRHIPLSKAIVGPAFLFALLGAWLGANAVSVLPASFLRPAILVLLVLVGTYTLVRKDFGQLQKRERSGKSLTVLAALVGFALGFYDGFFGPGTGSFLIFLFVRYFGMDLLHASAASKWVNTATNVAALAYFVSHEGVLWKAGLAMAVANVAGSQVGSRMAMKRGNEFVRVLLLCVVGALIAKLLWDSLSA